MIILISTGKKERSNEGSEKGYYFRPQYIFLHTKVNFVK